MIQPTPSGVLFTDEHRGSVRLLRVHYDGGEPEQVLGGQRQVLAASARDGVTVVTYADGSHPGEVAVVDPSCAGSAPSTSGSAPKTAVSPVVPLTATAPDGHPVCRAGWCARTTRGRCRCC